MRNGALAVLRLARRILASYMDRSQFAGTKGIDAMADYLAAVHRAVRDAAIRVVGHQCVGNEPQARVLIAVLEAFGQECFGLVYVEPTLRSTTKRPPDILLCHPDVGVVIFEVKGWRIESIERIEAGNFFIAYNGARRQHNPFHQASQCMYQVKNQVQHILKGSSLPLFSSIVVLPNVTRREWIKRGFGECVKHGELLLADCLEDPEAFRTCVLRAVGKQPRARLSAEAVAALEKAFGSSAPLQTNRSARPVPSQTLGHQIDQFMNELRVFSREQEELSRSPVGTVPRLIRGVAGCGKTAVLAAMAARYVKQRVEQARQGQLLFLAESAQPSARVLVTCFNRALVPFIEQKIRAAYREQTGRDLPAGVLTVKNIDAMAHDLSRTGLLNWISPDEKGPRERFRAFTAQLRHAASARPALFESMQYDIAFVDEAQDFDEAHYEFLLQLVRPHHQTGERPLIVYYDDAQNIYGRPRPSWKELGLNVTGRRSTVMLECFRNTRPIIEFASNVLLGSRAPGNSRPKLRRFADVSYLAGRRAIVEEPDWFTVRFCKRKGELPHVERCSSPAERTQRISELVRQLVEGQRVRFEDILVLATRTGTCDEIADQIARDSTRWSCRPAAFVRPYGRNPDRDRYIFATNQLTISTVHGAKGYDAPVVLLDITGLDAEKEEDRAKFYVGATRAAMLLVVIGVASDLLTEAEVVLGELRRRLDNGPAEADEQRSGS